MRLIDVDEIKLPRGFFEKVDNVPKFYEWLSTLPTVDAKPIQHGHWIVDEDGNIKCSECGHHGVGDNYCERCGAKMDEVKDND